MAQSREANFSIPKRTKIRRSREKKIVPEEIFHGNDKTQNARERFISAASEAQRTKSRKQTSARPRPRASSSAEFLGL